MAKWIATLAAVIGVIATAFGVLVAAINGETTRPWVIHTWQEILASYRASHPPAIYGPSAVPAIPGTNIPGAMPPNTPTSFGPTAPTPNAGGNVDPEHPPVTTNGGIPPSPENRFPPAGRDAGVPPGADLKTRPATRQ